MNEEIQNDLQSMADNVLPFPGPSPVDPELPPPVPVHRYTDLGLTQECAETTLSKGFNVKNGPAQVLLLAEEVGEALENFEEIEDPALKGLVDLVVQLGRAISTARAERTWADGFKLRPGHNLFEELADVEIRLRSFVGGNGLVAHYREALWAKMDRNKARPHLHGKKN